MRNDVKPVTHDPYALKPGDAPAKRPAARPKGDRRVDTDGDTPGPREQADYDAEHGSSVRRERGDRVDPAGPKRSAVAGTLGTGGAVTDASGTTGTVSRSSDRQTRTTGKLRDRDLERSARMGAAPDINVLNIPTGDSSFSVPVLMAAFVALFAVLAVVAFFSWPAGKKAVDPNAVPTAGSSRNVDAIDPYAQQPAADTPAPAEQPAEPVAEPPAADAGS